MAAKLVCPGILIISDLSAAALIFISFAQKLSVLAYSVLQINFNCSQKDKWKQTAFKQPLILVIL